MSTEVGGETKLSLLSFLAGYIQFHGYSPSPDEISEGLLIDRTLVWLLLRQLQKEGQIILSPTHRIGIWLTAAYARSVVAGVHTEAEVAAVAYNSDGDFNPTVNHLIVVSEPTSGNVGFFCSLCWSGPHTRLDERGGILFCPVHRLNFIVTGEKAPVEA